jgi:Ca2+-binding RTX toxin-like protein
MAILTVGSNMMYSSLGAAVAASKDGDIVRVNAGTYVNDTATINTKITIEGVGGMAKLVGSGDLANRKGLLISNTDLTVRNIEFSNAEVADRNGAGIRYQGGNLTVENCYFHHNENGILANPVSTGTISIKRSEFAFNGDGSGYTHGVYANNIAKLTVTDSYFHDTLEGHLIKSRAQVTEITNNRLYSGTSDTSYEIDLPNGGKGTITGNVIVQGTQGANPSIIAFGEEGNVYAGSSLLVQDNVIENFKTSATGIWNASSVNAQIIGNDFYQVGTQLSGPGSLNGNIKLSSPVTLDYSSPWLSAPTPTLNGTSGNDTLSGTSSSEIINGLAGNDRLSGNGGNDTLDGGAGRDVLTGGAGADIFRFSNAAHSTEAARDRITDFTHGQDLIDLHGTGFTDFITSGLTQAGELRLAYSATSDRSYLRSDQSTFEFFLEGDHRGQMSDADLIFG